MKDSEFLAEIKAREELETRGYRLIKCGYCLGDGGDPIGTTDTCLACGGRGEVWTKPVVVDDPKADIVSNLQSAIDGLKGMT
jgi:hypothetical protein